MYFLSGELKSGEIKKWMHIHSAGKPQILSREPALSTLGIGLLATTPSQGHGDTCLLSVACDDTARCMVAPVIE